MLYLYLPSCRALSLSASLCCFLQGIWRSLTLPSKSIVLAIHSPPIPLYLLSSSPSPHFFPPPVSSPPRISSLLIFLPYNPVCTILPLSPPLFLSYLITSPRASVFSSPVFFFLSFCHFPFPLLTPQHFLPQFSLSFPHPCLDTCHIILSLFFSCSPRISHSPISIPFPTLAVFPSLPLYTLSPFCLLPRPPPSSSPNQFPLSSPPESA